MSATELPWKTDLKLNSEEAGLLASKAFDLPCDCVEVLGEGWDYLNFLADEEWVLRFPKRESCDAVLVREKGILDQLSRVSLPVAVPYFEYLGEPGEGYPWHIAAYRYIPGTPLAEIRDSVSFRNIPKSIGKFLAILHQVSTEIELTDPWDLGDGDNWERREFTESLAAYPADTRKKMEAFLDRPYPAKPDLPHVLTHADLNAEHILVDPTTGEVTGIIDWADACTSVRTTDFVGLYYFGGRNYASQAYAAAGIIPNDIEWHWLEHAVIAMCIGQIFYGWNDNKPLLVEQGLERATLFL